MKFITYFFCLCYFFTTSQNIQTPVVYSADNQYILSASWAGIGDFMKFRSILSTQWTGIDNSPSTYIATLNGRINDKTGFGIIAYKDENGFTKIQHLTLSYAYHLILDYNSNQFLSFGISTRFSNFRTDTSQFTNSQPDPIINPNRKLNEINFDLGVLYRYNGYFITLNFTDILKTNNSFSENEPLSISTFNVYTGYEFKKPKQFLITPFIRFQKFFSDKRAEMDFGIKLLKEYSETELWSGSVLKLQTDSNFAPLSFTPFFGIHYKRLYITYGYQISIKENETDLVQNFHLISIGFDFLKLQSKCICTH